MSRTPPAEENKRGRSHSSPDITEEDDLERVKRVKRDVVVEEVFEALKSIKTAVSRETSGKIAVTREDQIAVRNSVDIIYKSLTRLIHENSKLRSELDKKKMVRGC